ncbi:MAG: hypothetical protein F6K47_22580 [Symploca sp. SIO2E6]|nr:hypothetical protein [Symploca sp. SIO2E6]
MSAQISEFSIGEDKWFIPPNLDKDEPLRAILVLNSSFTGRLVDDPLYRDFALRAKVALGPGRSTEAAEIAKRPELANLPEILIACSNQGFALWNVAVRNPNHHVAVISYHGIKHYNDLVANQPTPDDLRYRIPTLHSTSGRNCFKDGKPATKENVEAVSTVNGIGGFWSTLMEQGTGHCAHSYESMELILLWLEEVVAQRVRGKVPADGKVSLSEIDLASSYIGSFKFVQGKDPDPSEIPAGENINDYKCINPSYFADSAIHPYQEKVESLGATNGREYVWLPSRRFAQGWLNYHRTGNIRGRKEVHTVDFLTYYPRLNDAVMPTAGGMVFDWGYHYAFLLGVQGLQNQYHQVRWKIKEGSTPPGIRILANGRLRGSTREASIGIHRFTLQANYQGKSYDSHNIVALRGVNTGLHPETEPQALIKSHRSGDKIDLSVPVTFVAGSNKPIGEVRWHSSIDGELGRGQDLTIEKMSNGQHLLSALVWNATDAERDCASILIEVSNGI